MDNYTWITKTEAKIKYFLNDIDLQHLETKIAGCSYNKRSFSTLYCLDDIEYIFMIKHDIPREEIENRLEELQVKKENRKLKFQAGKKEKRDLRKNDLEKALKDKGLELRGDSKLCDGYIDGTIKDWSLGQIVRRMGEMKYLHEFCDFDSAYAKAEQEHQEEYEAGYYPDMSTFDRAEQIAITNSRGYPKVFPWEDKTQEIELISNIFSNII
jgi:hypothetical protein